MIETAEGGIFLCNAPGDTKLRQRSVTVNQLAGQDAARPGVEMALKRRRLPRVDCEPIQPRGMEQG